MASLLFIEQTCFRFDPFLDKHANLLVLFFYTRHDTFDYTLMYDFPIPVVDSRENLSRDIWSEEKN